MATNQLTPTQTEIRTPVAKLPLRQVANVKEMLVNDMAKQQLAAVAAIHMNPERMMRLMANAIRSTPKLGQCSPMSLLGAMMQCASLGLEPNTVLGHAYLIPFDKKARNPDTGKWEVVETNVQLIVGYKGLIDLARRSGHITSISANVHYSDDELWEYEEGTESILRHRPGNLEGEKKHAYAIAKFKDGGHAYVVLPWKKVMAIRDASQGWIAAKRSAETYKKSIDSPWATHEDEMAKKTAIRALAKLLPLSTEFVDAVQIDGARADFNAFAMDPTAGVQVEQYDDNEPDFTAAEEPEQLEDQRAGQHTIDQTPEREPAPRQSRPRQTKAKEEPKPEPKAQQEETAPADDEGQLPLGDDEETDNPAPASDFSIYVNKTREMIEGDMTDGMASDLALETYSADLENIAQQDPKAHAELVKMINDWPAN